MFHRTCLIIATAVAIPSAALAQSLDLPLQPAPNAEASRRVGTGKSPIGEPVKARAGEQVTVRLERVGAFPKDTAKTAVVRRRQAPEIVVVQILPTTSTGDLAHALYTVANTPSTTVSLRADEVRGFLRGATDSRRIASLQYFQQAEHLLQQLNRTGVAEGPLRLNILSSERP